MAGSIATAVMGQVVLVASGVVLARALGPQNRGVLALLFVLSATTMQIGSLGVPVSLTYWIAAEKSSPRALLRGLRSFRHLQLLAILAVQGGLILYVLEPKSPSGFLWVALLSLVATTAGISQMYGLAVLQGLRQFGAFNSLRLLNGTLYGLGVVGLWITDQATLTSITLVVICASVIAAGVTWLFVLRAAPVVDGRNEVATRRILSFGLRSLVGSSPPVETFRLDQLLVGLVLPPVALGYYVVALAFTNLTRFIGQSIGMVTYPRVAAAGDGRSQLRILRQDFVLGAAVCGSVTLALIVLVPWLLPVFFGSNFAPASTASQILLVAAFFASVRRILVDGTRGAGRPVWGATAELLTLLTLPAVLVATQYTHSLAAIALCLAGANLLGLFVIAPALFGTSYQREGHSRVVRRRAAVTGAMSRFALVAVLIAICAGVGAGISMIPRVTSTLAVVPLALVIGSVAFTPVVRRVLRSNFNVFEPIVGGAIMLGVLFSVRPLWMSSSSHSSYFGRATEPYLPWTLLVAAVGVASFVLGYELIIRRPHPSRPAESSHHFDFNTLTLFAVLVATLSVGLYAVYLAKAGSVMAGFELLARGRSSDVVNVLGGSSQYLAAAPALAASLAAVLLAVTVGRRFSFAERSGYALAAIYPAACFSLLGDRRFLIPSIAVPVATYYLSRGKRVSRKWLAVAVPILLIVLSTVAYGRTVGARQESGGAANLLVQAFQRPATTWSRFIEGPDTEMISALALETSVLNDPGSFGYGRATIGDLAVSPIPSAVLPSKPASSQDVLLKRIFGAPCDAFGGICSDFSAIGSFYFDFWLPGVILGMASLGAGSALLWRRYLVRRDPVSSFVAATWTVFLPILLRAGFMPAFSWFLIFLVPGLLILHVAALAPSATRRRPQAGQALGRAS